MSDCGPPAVLSASGAGRETAHWQSPSHSRSLVAHSNGWPTEAVAAMGLSCGPCTPHREHGVCHAHAAAAAHGTPQSRQRDLRLKATTRLLLDVRVGCAQRVQSLGARVLSSLSLPAVSKAVVLAAALAVVCFLLASSTSSDPSAGSSRSAHDSSLVRRSAVRMPLSMGEEAEEATASASGLVATQVAALGDSPHRLVVLIPFVSSDIERLLQGMRDWAALGPACRANGAETGLGLRFFHSKSAAVYDAARTAYLHRLALELEGFAANVALCFASLDTVFADVTEEQDGYPEGPSNMFFKLMLTQARQLLPSFTHMYWMEWDVRPVRLHWLDELQAATYGERFWVRGARYRGRAFDEVVKDPGSWPWVGHINGNALYLLHDAEFLRFLSLTVEQEPPSHFWKPFDVSIWKTLHDFPYAWHLHQVHAGKFQTTAVMQHLGFTVRPDEVSALIASAPRVHLIHGDTRSAGGVNYPKKFDKAGLARSNASVRFTDEITAGLRVSVLCRTTAAQLAFASLALQSAQRYLPGAIEFVAVVPERDLEQAEGGLPHFVTVMAERPQLRKQDDALQLQLTTLQAHHYTAGSFVFHLPTDAVLSRPVLRRDLFVFNRPIVSFTRYANLPAAGSRQAAISLAVGTEAEVDVHEPAWHFFHRSVYQQATLHLETTHSTTLPVFLQSCCRDTAGRTAAANPSAPQSRAPGRHAFSSLSYLTAYLYLHEPSSVSWLYEGDDAHPPYSLPWAYSPVRPQLLCRGDAALGDAASLMAQLDVLQRAARGHMTACAELQALITATAGLFSS